MKEKENIVPDEIPEKNEYYLALMNIEHSWTGRVDAQLANTFIMEAVQLIRNSIVLYEKGFFDCAFYSLRQSIEVSTTMIYLSDIPEDLREEKLENWKKTREFPMQGQMLAYLKQNGYLFSDLKEKLSDFLDQLDTFSKYLNKCVHKQGLKYFYVSRNHPFNRIKMPYEKYKHEFKLAVEKCIGVVAIMRLAIDPYPILLIDEEIYSRSFDTMTSPYNKEFVEKYIGKQDLINYKKTEIYNLHYEQHMQQEKMLDSVVDIVKHQYINKKQKEQIITQLHLLEQHDLWAVMLVLWCDKAVKVYCHGGFRPYFTDSNSNRKDMSWSSMDFKKFSESTSNYNQIYDEAYVSVFVIHNEEFFLEHNERLTDEEINRICSNIYSYSQEQ